MFDLGAYEYFEDENLALLRHGPSNLRVLDVGCGSSVLGMRLRQRGNAVWGVDSASDIAEAATQRLDRFMLADITDHAAINELLDGEHFDVIVFADVLEHLPDPVGTLRSYRRFLAPGGMVLVSVPNVAVWNVRVGLLLGHFQYTATGTLDRTHLRFFTRANLQRALTEAGLRVEQIDVNPGVARVFVGRAKRVIARGREGNRRALLDSREYRVYRRLVYPLEYRVARLMPGLFAFQYVAVARAGESSK
jgi:2-polyprenyl-3-methyl-5-hydroxy-6-metoxy-1,4-benzoquinol methylase